MKAEARPTFIEIEERLSAVLKELKEAEQKTKDLVLEEKENQLKRDLRKALCSTI